MQRQRHLLPLLLTLLALGACGEKEPVPESFVRSEAWDSETLELAGLLPIMGNGRVKPMDTFAGFQLLELNGKRSFKLPNREKLTRTGFLLDCLFFPEQARDYRCFRVSNSEVLSAIGVEATKRAARYTYNELAVGRDALFGEAGRISGIERPERSLVEKQILALAAGVRDFETLTGTLEFARVELPVPREGQFGDLLGDLPERGVSKLLPALELVFDRLETLSETERVVESPRLEPLTFALQDLVHQSESGLKLFPPETTVAEEETWHTSGDIIRVAFQRRMPAEASARWLGHLEAMLSARNERTVFRGELEQLLAGVRGEAQRRGEYGMIASEVALFRFNPFGNALVLFIGACLLVSLTWLFSGARWLRRAVWGLVVAGTALVVIGVTWRSVLRGRPPVVNLYDTILFITGTGCIVGIIIELINRKRVALALVPLLGALGMFLALKHEVKDAALSGDTMTAVMAVLDTNFWLATHVTSITFGYSAGLLATIFSMTWILLRVSGFRRGDGAFYRDITKMTYGLLCFGLLLSVVGTILGGVWANESWGRFWGWDPKENGALLIVLVQLIILHSRLGGFIRQHGLHALTCFQGAVVAFSWWHVNELGAGMHAYGETEGVLFALAMFYGLQGLMILLCGLSWLLERSRGKGLDGGLDDGEVHLESGAGA
jgi:ABC-type transport system involved in cytochrome c biogenesis permease subunit